MQSSASYLPGFSHRLCGRRARSEATRLRGQSTALDGLVALVARFMPAEAFVPLAGQRERVFTPWVTFVAFLGQVLSRGSACREPVRRVQAWCVATKQAVPDESTSAYCQARARLPLESLRAAHEQLGGWIERHTQEAWQWSGRAVKVLDGCGISMSDTDENRARWPYAGCQQPGCGFPTAQLVGLFCLATPLFAPAMLAFRRARQELLRIIAADQVPDRPTRSEPRVRKRRPKSYQLLTRPRHEMAVSPSRALK